MNKFFTFLLASALLQCVLCGRIIISKPSKDIVETGTCLKISLNTQEITDAVSYKIIFEYENGGVAFTKTSTIKSGIDITFPQTLTTYKYYAQALDKDDNVLETSPVKTIVVADLVCYPEKCI